MQVSGARARREDVAAGLHTQMGVSEDKGYRTFGVLIIRKGLIFRVLY